MRSKNHSLLKAVVVVGFVFLSGVLHLEAQYSQGLQGGFYSQTCGFVEYIIKDEVRKGVMNDQGMAAGLVRLHFHDCFVRGCDASVLIDSTPSNTAEKDASPNYPSLRGFEIIDSIKARLEAMCPGVVSCADILAFAARDATEMAGGMGYDVPAGRRDGLISIDIDAYKNLPPATADIDQLTKIFASKGLSRQDMVSLSGAHTIGRSHCTSISGRLYNFSTNAAQDPSLDSSYATQLKQQCPSWSSDTSSVVPMDPSSPMSLDIGYYKGVLSKQGLFGSDQALMSASDTANLVNQYTYNPYLWQQDFATSMVNMGNIEVLTGYEGEIRLNCRVPN